MAEPREAASGKLVAQTSVYIFKLVGSWKQASEFAKIEIVKS